VAAAALELHPALPQSRLTFMISCKPVSKMHCCSCR
jgi:hypothetical protein